MKNLIPKAITSLLIIFIPFISTAQTTETNYFADRAMLKRTTKNKAWFAYSKTQGPGDTLTIELKNLKDEIVLKKEVYVKDEPVGEWIVSEEQYKGKYKTQVLDYNFKLAYDTSICRKAYDSTVSINFKYLKGNGLSDIDSSGYVAPKLAVPVTSLGQFIANNIVYSGRAVNYELQGSVYVSFVVQPTGEVTDVAIHKGVDAALDKEAMRVVRKLKFANPPLLNGKARRVCFRQPVTFKLEE